MSESTPNSLPEFTTPSDSAPELTPPRIKTVVFGSVGLLFGLGVLAALPVLQFMTLGWLLEAQGRVGRGRRFREAVPGLRQAARVGSGVLGCLLLAVPALVLYGAWQDARLLAPGSETERTLGAWTWTVSTAVGLHACLALLAGHGALKNFFRPVHNVSLLVSRWAHGGSQADILATCWAGWRSLRLSHYLQLGAQGFAAGVCWLVLPITFLLLGPQAPALGLLGGLALAWGVALPGDRSSSLGSVGRVSRRLSTQSHSALLKASALGDSARNHGYACVCAAAVPLQVGDHSPRRPLAASSGIRRRVAAWAIAGRLGLRPRHPSRKRPLGLQVVWLAGRVLGVNGLRRAHLFRATPGLAGISRSLRPTRLPVARRLLLTPQQKQRTETLNGRTWRIECYFRSPRFTHSI